MSEIQYALERFAEIGWVRSLDSDPRHVIQGFVLP